MTRGRRPVTYYVLEGDQIRVEPDVARWHAWFQMSAKERTLAQSQHGPSEVRTVFSGVDTIRRYGVPLLYATNVIGGPPHGMFRPYASAADALLGHRQVVQVLEKYFPVDKASMSG